MKIQIFRGKLGNQVYKKNFDIISTLKRKFFIIKKIKNKKKTRFFLVKSKNWIKNRIFDKISSWKRDLSRNHFFKWKIEKQSWQWNSVADFANIGNFPKPSNHFPSLVFGHLTLHIGSNNVPSESSRHTAAVV